MTVFWCAGGYASGSTWAYNIMRAVAAVGFGGRVRTSRFAQNRADLAGIEDAAGLHVVKTYDVPADAAGLLLAQAPRVVVTVRDPRDAVTSLMRFQGDGFEKARKAVAKSNWFAARLVEKGTEALVLRFEDRFTEDAAGVMRIADYLGIALTPGAAAAIFAAHRREAVERFIAKLPGAPGTRPNGPEDWFDVATQWHRHHAGRDGEIGRWKRLLLPGQPNAIEAECGVFMDRFGYQRAPLHQPGYALKMGGFTLDI